MSKRSSCRPRVHLGSAPMRWVTSGAQGLLHGLEVGAHLAHQRRDLRGGLARGRRDDFPEGVAGRPRAERDGLTGGVGLRAHTLAAALAGVDLGDGARRRRRAAEARHELVRVAQRPAVSAATTSCFSPPVPPPAIATTTTMTITRATAPPTMPRMSPVLDFFGVPYGVGVP